MGAIENYTNTQLELASDEARLKSLLLDKEALYQKYCGVKAISYTDEPKIHSSSNSEPMLIYIAKCDEINKFTGMSLNEEIEKLNKDVQRRRGILKQIESVLERLQGIEYELFRLIIYHAYSPTKAVRICASKYAYSEKVIWEKYYSLIKVDVKRLRKVVSKR